MSEKYSIEQIAEIAKALGIAQKNDPASSTLTGQTLHGPNLGGASTSQFGLFSAPGVRPDMLSAMARTSAGLFNLVTLSQSDLTQELIEIMTGQKEGTGDVSTGYCGDAPRAGDLKVMQRVFKYGDHHVKTALNSVPDLGQRKNRADVPRNILNGGSEANPLIPESMFGLADTQSQLQTELFKVGVQLQRDLEIEMIQGVQGASSTTIRTAQTQFDGLDSQIKTGYEDAVTGIVTPVADSAVITFGADVAATIAGGDGRNIVEAVSDLYYALSDRASGVDMNGVQWAFVMRKEAFRSIVNQWVCNYATYRCDDGSAGNPLNRDVTSQNQLRLEMMNGQYLLVDGIQIPVVFSEGIPNTQSSNFVFESDIYLVPYAWAGMPLLRLEYFNMANPYATEYSNYTGETTRTLNNGLYMVARKDLGFCIEYHFASKMRLILETPFLAGRIDNVQYTFRAPIHNSLPGASFYTNGGATFRG